MKEYKQSNAHAQVGRPAPEQGIMNNPQKFLT
jgi:hypothetical protein